MKTLVVLAGGLGTRLRSLVDDVPKPMAPVLGRPFVSWLIDAWLGLDFSFDQLVFSVGYKSHVIQDYFGTEYKRIPVKYSREETPLGTGGALIKACCLVDDEVCVVNGDTWFVPPLAGGWPIAGDGIEVCLLLKYSDDVSRYGAVTRDSNGMITSIKSELQGSGYLNGGVYFINREAVNVIGEHTIKSTPLSLEHDLFPSWIDDKKFGFKGVLMNQPFLDIGIPEDYLKADSFIKTNFETLK